VFLFLLLVALMAALLLIALLRSRPTGSPPTYAFATWAGVLALWLAVPGVLAARGMLTRFNPLPAPGLVVIGVITVATVALAYSPVGGRMAAQISMAWLVGFQAFRLPLELLLHRLYGEGYLPVQMTYAGRNFDIVTGITALVLWFVLRRGAPQRALVLAWNLLGMALLINVVAVAVLSTPVPFRQFVNEPPVLVPAQFPWSWLPTFLVQAALFGHLLVFRALRRQAG